MERKLLFIFNPLSGKAHIKNHLVGIVDLFTKHGYDVTVHPTQCGGDARDVIIEKGKDYDLVVCSGGDGTLDEAVSGMLQAEIETPLGYIPAGSTNDFAVSLHIPKTMLGAAKNVMEGRSFSCDVGRLNGKPFVYIAAFGLFTEVSYETPQGIKNVLGHAAYLLEGVKKLADIKAFPVHVVGDDIDIEDEFVYGMVTNSTSAGGFKNITGKNVKLNDGLFEVTLIKQPKNPVEFQKIVTALLNGSEPNEKITTFKTSHLTITSKEPLAWTTDGEFGGKHTQVEIENQPRALKILIPQKKEK